jgi:hypothetical protein
MNRSYYVHESQETGQQCLVAAGEDGGAVLDDQSIEKLLVFDELLAALCDLVIATKGDGPEVLAAQAAIAKAKEDAG